MAEKIYGIVAPNGDTIQVTPEQIRKLYQAGRISKGDVFSKEAEVEAPAEPVGPTAKAKKYQEDAIKLIQREAGTSIVPILAMDRNDILDKIQKERDKGYDPMSLTTSMDPRKIRNLQKVLKLRDAYDNIMAVESDEDVDNVVAQYTSDNPYLDRIYKKMAYKQVADDDWTLFPEFEAREGEGGWTRGFGAAKDIFTMPGRGVAAGIAAASDDPYLSPAQEFSMPSKYKTVGREVAEEFLSPIPGAGVKAGLRGVRGALPLGGALRGAGGRGASMLTGVPRLQDAARGVEVAENVGALGRMTPAVLKEAPLIASETGFQYTRPEEEGGGLAPALASLLGGTVGAAAPAGFRKPGVVPGDELVRKYAGIYGKPRAISGAPFIEGVAPLQSALKHGEERLYGAYLRESPKYSFGGSPGALRSASLSSLEKRIPGAYFLTGTEIPEGVNRETIDAALKKVSGGSVGVGNIQEASMDDLLNARNLLPSGPEKDAINKVYTRSTTAFPHLSDGTIGEFSYRLGRQKELGAAEQFARRMADPLGRATALEKAAVRDPSFEAGQELFNKEMRDLVVGFEDVDVVPEAVLTRVSKELDQAKKAKKIPELSYTSIKKNINALKGMKQVTGAALRKALKPMDVVESVPSAALMAGTEGSVQQSETDKRWQDYMQEMLLKRQQELSNLLSGQ